MIHWLLDKPSYTPADPYFCNFFFKVYNEKMIFFTFINKRRYYLLDFFSVLN